METKVIIMSSESFSHKKIGSSCKIDDIETEKGTCFPIEVVVLVAFNSSLETQTDSKSRIATLLNNL